MSGSIAVIIRRAGVVTTVDASSGSLQSLYDPDIYAGDEAAIQAFVNKARDPDIQCGVAWDALQQTPLAPVGLGIVVLDFDTKTQWDWQRARWIRLLSYTHDWSWIHASKWVERCWLGAGLVHAETGCLMHAYPDFSGAANPGGRMLFWYEQMQGQHDAAQAPAVEKDFRAIIASAPRMRIEPEGWMFVTIDNEGDPAGLQSLLKAAGFPIMPADDDFWRLESDQEMKTAGSPDA